MVDRQRKIGLPRTSVLSRREYLRNSVNAGVAIGGNCMISANLFAWDKPKETDFPKPQVRLGFGNYGMRSLPAIDAIKQCARIGYQGIELCLIEGWPTALDRLPASERASLAEALDENNLFVPSLLESLPCLRGDAAHQTNLKRLRDAAEFATGLRQKHPPVIQSIVGGKSTEWEKHKDQLVTELRDWAEVGSQAGITICFKPHASHLVTRPEQALWIVEQVGSPTLKVVYDYSHFHLEGLSLKSTLNALLPVVPYIQVKDSRRNRDGKYRYLLPGDGMTNYPVMFSHLINAGYEGFVNVEVSSMIHRLNGYDPVATAQLCFDRLQPILDQALKDK